MAAANKWEGVKIRQIYDCGCIRDGKTKKVYIYDGTWTPGREEWEGTKVHCENVWHGMCKRHRDFLERYNKQG